MRHVNHGETRSTAHEHASVADARDCEATYAYEKAEALSEIRAEQAVERHYESAGIDDTYRERQEAFYGGFPSLEASY